MNLKKGDRILSVGRKQIDSSSAFRKSLRSAVKKSKPFQIKFQRGGKKLAFIYQSTPYKSGKYKLKRVSKNPSRQIASPESSPPPKKTAKSSPSSKKTSLKKSPPSQAGSKRSSKTTKKSLLPEKYKPYMQRAYISRSNSFVYSEPNFDAPKLQTLPIGKLVLISRKVFLPPHSFGSFYRIFLFREKKVIGYVSEAEVIPEFVKKNDSYSPNPNYKKAKNYKAKKQILKIEDIEDSVTQNKQLQIQKETQKRLSLQSNYKKYAGLSLGYSPYLNYASPQPYENMFLGLKLSTYSSKIHLDWNLDIYRYKASFDFLAGFSVVKSKSYSLFALGGGHIEYSPLNSNTYLDQIDVGPVGAVSLLIPLNKKFLLKLESKVDYKARKRLFSLKFLSGLQLSF